MREIDRQTDKTNNFLCDCRATKGAYQFLPLGALHRQTTVNNKSNNLIITSCCDAATAGQGSNTSERPSPDFFLLN